MKTTKRIKAYQDDDSFLLPENGTGTLPNIYRRYKPIVADYLSSLNGRQDYNVIEDMTQEVFVRLWQNRKKFKGEAALKTYLFGIAKNIWRDQQKHISRHSRYRLPQNPDRLIYKTDDLTEPESKAHHAELLKAVNNAAKKLTLLQKQALYLFYLEDMSLHQAAAHTQCSPEAFRNRLRRSRRKLTRLLKHLAP